MKLNFFRLKLISLTKKSKSSQGFTLTELLIGASLTLIVVGAAGFGLYQTMRGSKTGNNQAERRSEIARAYEFISDEMRRSRLILGNDRLSDPDTLDDDEEYLDQQVKATIPNTPSNPPFYQSGTTTVATGLNVVLALKIPVTNAAIDKDGNNNNEATIVYYVKNPPSGSVWKGPKVLYRWGPPINNSGDYDIGNWQEKPLIDQLDSASVSPSCGTGWTTSNAPGFAACIDPEGKVAQIYLNGEIVTADGDEKYQGSTKTAARASDQTAINVTSLDNRTYSLGGDFSCFGTPLNTDTELKLYKADGSPVYKDTEDDNGDGDTTETKVFTIKEGGSNDLQVSNGQTLTVTSKPNSCNDPNPSDGVTTSTNPVTVNIQITGTGPITYNANSSDYTNNKIKVFKNGDYISDDSNYAYTGQQTLKEFLESKGVTMGTVSNTDMNGDGLTPDYPIQLNNNQLLVAFEIGQNSQYLTGTTPNPGWDFQDNLVLINVQ
jgi:type II secretory pathway pseudopilin PulG